MLFSYKITNWCDAYLKKMYCHNIADCTVNTHLSHLWTLFHELLVRVHDKELASRQKSQLDNVKVIAK